MNFKKLFLQKGKDKALERKHPWIFSGAFKSIPKELENGELVEVYNHREDFVAMGFFQRGAITVKVLSFEAVTDVKTLIEKKVKAAIEYRKTVGILDLPGTDCCRLIFAEGDGLPGLIADKYAKTAVIQVHHAGWLPYLNLIAQILHESNLVSHVYSKPADKLKADEKFSGDLLGEKESDIALEYGHQFIIDWQGGQKTGFFVDQRENRKKLANYSKGKSVLNTFSYTGGFSIYALKAGATNVVSVDISKLAVELANENAKLNGFTEKHEGVAADVFDFLNEKGNAFDIIVLDPPAFSKSRKTTHNAVQGYKRLNLMAMQKIKKGGLIFTFSCSQHIQPKLFEDTIRAAAIESGRRIRIVEKLTQPADHPINIYHPEGEYLKGLILEIS